MLIASLPPLDVVHLNAGITTPGRGPRDVPAAPLSDVTDEAYRAIVGANIRNDMAQAMAALAAQGAAYTLEAVTPEGLRSYERIGSITRLIPYAADLAGLIAAGADPATRIISFTVTEAGYYLDPHECLDSLAPDLAADLAAARAGRAGHTIYGALLAMLRARRSLGAGPVTLLNCDNLRHNGERFRTGLLQFVELAGDSALAAWIEQHTSCPNAMVDRITPRPAPEVRERVKAATGEDDAAALMAESFIQWVIEDRFVAGRPAWERVGVQMVESVAPFEEAKIRLLNAPHSCIAWAGTLVGHRFIHEGTLDATIRRFAFDYVTDDVIPVLSPSPIDLAAYRDTVLERFANPAIADTNQRVAMDGFSKIPGFIAPTIRERLARDESIESVALLPALFLAFLHRWHESLLPYTYQDQAMNEAVAHAICAAADPVAAMAADVALWGPLARDERLTAALRRASQRVAQFVAGRKA